MVQDEQQGPTMTDLTLVLGEWDTPEAGLRGHLQCSTDIFTESSARRFAASLKVCEKIPAASALECPFWAYSKVCTSLDKRLLRPSREAAPK